jgi:Niemann-Pick C1 protein
MVQSLTGFWQDDSTQFHRSVQKANGSFAAALQRCVDTPTSCLPSFQQPINIDLVVGGLGIGEDVLNGRALIVTILLNNYLDAEKVRSVKIWEDRLVQYLLQKREYLVRSYGIKLSFNTEVSFHSHNYHVKYPSCVLAFHRNGN